MIGAWQAAKGTVVGSKKVPLILVVDEKNAAWCAGNFAPSAWPIVRLNANKVVWQHDGETEEQAYRVAGTNLTMGMQDEWCFVRLPAVPPELQEVIRLLLRTPSGIKAVQAFSQGA